MLALEVAASYGPKSSLVHSEPVEKHGSGVADESVSLKVTAMQDFKPPRSSSLLRAVGRSLAEPVKPA